MSESTESTKAKTERPFSTPRMAELEAELATTRTQLASTVDELAGRLTPRALADQGIAGARRLWSDAVGSQAPAPARSRARLVLGGVAATAAVLVVAAVRGRH